MYEQQTPFELVDYIALSSFLNNFLYKAIQENIFGKWLWHISIKQFINWLNFILFLCVFFQLKIWKWSIQHHYLCQCTRCYYVCIDVIVVVNSLRKIIGSFMIFDHQHFWPIWRKAKSILKCFYQRCHILYRMKIASNSFENMCTMKKPFLV